MAWELSNASPAWELGTTNYTEASPSDFTIESAPAEVLRGGSHSVVCTNVSEAPSAATLDGQPVTVDAWDVDGIDFTVPDNTLAGHGTDKVLSFTVAGVTQTVALPHNPATGDLVTTLTSFDPGETNVFEGMIDLDTDEPMTPEVGGQIIYDELADTYPVLFQPDGSLEIDTDGAALTGMEAFVFRYLIPGVGISNPVTISLSDYLEPSAPVMPADITVEVDEGQVSIPTLGNATSFESGVYSISGGDSSLFNINEDTGVVTFKAAPDYESGNNSLSFTRTFTNSEGSDSQLVQVIVNNVIEDSTPTPIVFDDIGSAEPGETYTRSVILGGFESGATLEAVNLELSNNGADWFSSVTGIPGITQARISVVASEEFETTVATQGTVNGVETNLTVTTRAAITSPNEFGFSPKLNVMVDTIQESNSVTINGIEVEVVISVVNGEYSVDSGEGFGSYTSSPGTIQNGDVVKVRHTSSTNEATVTTTTLTVEDRSASFLTKTIGVSVGTRGINRSVMIPIMKDIFEDITYD